MRQAGVMLIIRDGLILGITRRHDNNVYGLPGGKVEEGETPGIAACREAYEETGIKVFDCVLVYKRVELGDGANQVYFDSYCYYAVSWEGEPQSSEEGDIKWLTPEEITSTKTAFGDYNRK